MAEDSFKYSADENFEMSAIMTKKSTGKIKED